MKINCENGYYSFYPELQRDLYLFTNFLGIELVWNIDHYTYPLLKDLKNYVISPNPYGSFPTPYPFEGTPKQIMKEFDLVYNLATGTLVPFSSVVLSGRLTSLGPNWMSERAMIQSGMFIGSGKIRSYDGVFDFDTRRTVVRYFE